MAVTVIPAATLSASPVGTVSGTVKDSSGAIVAGVRLTLTSTATNAQFSTTTNPQGVDAIDLPVGPGHRLLGWNNSFNRQAFGGWQISGITTVQSGAPFTVFNKSADYSGFNQFAERPDVVGSGRIAQDNRNPDAAFDTSYFSKTPPTGRVGASGRDRYYGPV